ncbi:class I SAM-dependent methyltransferase [Pelotomaculum propionicicum]|uniref:class I SAM-dependent methyltransferase n=1 Tax=Pelotomaculum propionicicum TaxID=258475 RepID=UPI003B7C261B
MSYKVNCYKERSKKYFDKKASNFFDTFDGKFCRLMYEGVMQRIKMQPFRSILDIGCGTGAMLSLVISEYKDIQACGIDLSENMIEKAAGLLDSRVQLVVGDSDYLPWADNSFDLAVCNSSFHHFPEPTKVLNEIRRVLTPGGRMIIADPWWPNPKRYFINLFLDSPLNYLGDVRIYSETETREILAECGFITANWEIVNKKYSIAIAVVKN